MAHGLDVVAVGIEDEGAVVGRVVMRADAGAAVVARAGGERRGENARDTARSATGRTMWSSVDRAKYLLACD
jgi:hypothetical protein